MIAISSCLMGVKCRYNGTMSHDNYLSGDSAQEYVVICPEILAGFEIPRLPFELVGGNGEDVLMHKAKVISRNGEDITEQMICGARKALEICLNNNVNIAYLHAKSPSCGCGTIYDGSSSGTLIDGNGGFTALLLQHNITVVEVSVESLCDMRNKRRIKNGL